MAEVYLDINLAEFEKQKPEAIETAKADGNEDNATFPDLKWNLDNAQTQIEADGSIYISGELGKLGYMSATISLDLEDISELIEFYIKKLNRLKTVLEATK